MSLFIINIFEAINWLTNLLWRKIERIPLSLVLGEWAVFVTIHGLSISPIIKNTSQPLGYRVLNQKRC